MMEFVKCYLEEHWDDFVAYLISLGIPEDDAEVYANEQLEKLKRMK